MNMLLKSLAVVALFAGVAEAQEDWDAFDAVWEHDMSAEVTGVAAPDADESLLYAANIDFASNRVLDGGLEIGVVLEVAVQQDNPTRAGFSGVVAFDPATPFYKGAFSGLATSPVEEDIGPRGQFEAAYIYAKGGYGELRLGRGQGMAARVYEGGPSIFRHASTANARLDPTGATFVRTEHDLTGPATKVSYSTPRLLGVEAGVSFTPEADARGLDRDPARDIPGVGGVSIENAIEFGVNVSRRLPRGGARIKAGVAYSLAQVSAPQLTNIDDVETWSAGLSVEGDTIMVGASVLSSNNGISNMPGDYDSWAVGVSKKALGLTFAADYGESTDNLIGLESEAWSVGAARKVNENMGVALGWREQNRQFDGVNSIVIPNGDDQFSGIVVEITLSTR